MLKLYIIMLCAILSTAASATPPVTVCTQVDCERSQRQLGACDEALNACQGVIVAEDASIKALKAQVSKLDDSIVSAQQSDKNSKVVYFILGVVLSGAVVYTLHR